MLRKQGIRIAAALAVAALLAGPLAAAENGPGGRWVGAGGLWQGLESLWNWVQAALGADSDKGHSIDPNGLSNDPDEATSDSDKGSHVDPNG